MKYAIVIEIKHVLIFKLRLKTISSNFGSFLSKYFRTIMTIIKNSYNQMLIYEFEIEFRKCALALIITKLKWGFLIVLKIKV